MNEGTIVSAGESILAGPMTAPNVMEPSVHCYRMQGAVPCSIATPLAGTTEELRISLQFDTKELPFLQVWQDMRAHRSDVVFPTFAPGDFALQA
jgi:hypothetical protein